MLVKHALKTAIAAALLAAVFQGSEEIAYFVYPALGLILTMQSSLGSTVKAAWGQLCGSAIGGVVGAWFATTMGISPVTAGLAFILATLICQAYRLQAPYIFAGVISVLVAAQLVGGDNPWLYAFNRVLDNWIGVMIGIGVTLLFWPANPRKTLSNNLIKVLHSSNQLFQAIVAIYRSGDQESTTGNLLTEMKRTIQQSKGLLAQEMYGPVGSQLAEDNWSELLAAEDRLHRQLSFMLKALQKFDPNLSSRQFTEPLVLIAQQLSATCAGLTQVVRLTGSASSGFFRVRPVIDRSGVPAGVEIPTLTSYLQSITDQISWMRTTGTIKNYPFQQVQQFYVFLRSLREFLQELDQLAITLLHRERITAKTEARPGFKLHSIPPERIRQILKTGLAVGLSLAILNDFLRLPFDLFAVVAVVIAMQPTFGKSMAMGSQRVITTGIGAVVALFLINTLGSNLFTMALANALIILTCSYLGFSHGYIVGYIIVTFSLLSYSNDPNSFIWGFFAETLVGTVIAIIFSVLFWPSTSSQQLNQEISQTLIKLGSLYKMLVNSYLEGTDLQVATAQLTREIQQSLQTQASLQTETQQEQVHHLTAPRTQRRWNYLLSYEKELSQNISALQDTVNQDTGVNLPQDLQDAIQASAQATVLSFNSLAAALAQQPSQQKFSSSLSTFNAVEQALLRLRTSGTGFTYSLDEVISWLTVLSAMQEIAENLDQMTTDWPFSST